MSQYGSTKPRLKAEKDPNPWQLSFTGDDEENVEETTQTVDLTFDELNEEDHHSGKKKRRYKKQKAFAYESLKEEPEELDLGNPSRRQSFPSSSSASRDQSFPSSTSANNIDNDVIVFQNSHTDVSQADIEMFTKPFTERQWEAVELTPEAHYSGRKFIVRTDSDLELAFPGARRKAWYKQITWCCGCTQWVLWRSYACVVVSIVLIVLVYLVIILSVLSAFDII